MATNQIYHTQTGMMEGIVWIGREVILYGRKVVLFGHKVVCIGCKTSLGSDRLDIFGETIVKRLISVGISGWRRLCA